MISKIDGNSLLFLINIPIPFPRLVPTNNWGNIPIIEPKKNTFILTLKRAGSMFEIKKGIPPTNL